MKPAAISTCMEGATAVAAYSDMVDTLRSFLDALACAEMPAESAALLASDLRSWTTRILPLAADEPRRMFGRLRSMPSRGQVLCPVFSIREQNATSCRANVYFGDYYLGINGAAHGGAVALLFDEILGIPATADVSTFVRTVNLDVNYRSLTPIGRELEVTANLISIDGRKRVVHGEIRDGNRLCADAEGLFVELLPHQI